MNTIYEPTLSKRDFMLEALNDGYYRELRGSTGARGFWEWSRGGVPRRTSITGFVFGEHWRQLLSLALTRGQARLVLGAVAAAEVPFVTTNAFLP